MSPHGLVVDAGIMLLYLQGQWPCCHGEVCEDNLDLHSPAQVIHWVDMPKIVACVSRMSG